MPDGAHTEAFAGGPADGRTFPNRVRLAATPGAQSCYRPAGSPADQPESYAHYRRDADVYRYVGPCTDFDHGGVEPWLWRDCEPEEAP